eukprot:128160_1
MDRQITMFLALLLFASSVLASAGNAENAGDPTVTWSYFVPGRSNDESHRSSFRPHMDSKSIENAYQSFLVGGAKQFQVTPPAGFRPFSRRYMHGNEVKVTIDFELMQQYLDTAVAAVRRSGDNMCRGPVRWLWFRSDHHETNEWAEYEEKFQNPIESAYRRSLARESRSEAKVDTFKFGYHKWIFTFDFNKWTSKHVRHWSDRLHSRGHPVPLWRKCLPSTGATATNVIQFVQPGSDPEELFEELVKPKIVPKESSASTGNNEPTRFIFVAFPLMIVFGLAVYCAYKAKYISL